MASKCFQRGERNVIVVSELMGMNRRDSLPGADRIQERTWSDSGLKKSSEREHSRKMKLHSAGTTTNPWGLGTTNGFPFV